MEPIVCEYCIFYNPEKEICKLGHPINNSQLYSCADIIMEE